MIDKAKDKLRDLAEARLSLYVWEMGEEFFAKLVANKANWRVGYVPQHDCYWVLPQTDKGRIVVGPFTAVKWPHNELLQLAVPVEYLYALVDEAKRTGFEQWANPEMKTAC